MQRLLLPVSLILHLVNACGHTSGSLTGCLLRAELETPHVDKGWRKFELTP